jgi:RNA polymerase sigma-70 factor (ECF subfamily)
MTSPLPRLNNATGAISDEALVVRAQEASGGAQAFAEIVERFEGRLFNFIARRLGLRRLRTDAEDLTQETFLRAWRNIHEYRPHFRFSTWLFTIASRLVVDHQRHQAVKQASTDAIAERAASRETFNEHEVRHDLRAAGAELWSLAARLLTDEQHAALWLRYAEDLSPAEVARVLDRNEVAVRVMLFRARQTLAPHAIGALAVDGDADDGSFPRGLIAAAATGGVA